MDKTKKQKMKKIVAIVCVLAIILLFTVMPLLAKQEQSENEPKASILSGVAEIGNINREVIGGGTLAEEDAFELTIPSSVKLKKYLVSNGDTVQAGTPIASVDRVTVMTAISQVQETLDYLAKEIEAEREKETDGKITALAGGTVKIVYAEKGDLVQDVMLEHGTLAVLSLDGLMAVDFETTSELKAGSAVDVVLSNGTTAEGKVEKNLLGEMTVTIEDDGYAVDETIQVKSEDGTVIGSGKLYIFSPWNATAYAGTIDSIKVEKGDKVDAGDTLMKLKDIGYTATYSQLVSQRQAYEELMITLFQMYQTETITAPCNGVVWNIDETQFLGTKEQMYKVALLANAPNGNNEMLYSNYIGKVTAIEENSWTLRINPQSFEVADYMQLFNVSLDTSAMTDEVVYYPNQAEGASAPIYEQQNGAWVQISTTSIAKDDILLLAGDTTGNTVWIVRVQKTQTDLSETTPPSETTTPSDTSTPSETTPPSDTNSPSDTSTPSDTKPPSDTNSPSDTSTPSDTNPPSDTNSPSGTNPPSDMNMPNGSNPQAQPNTQTNPNMQGSPNITYPSMNGSMNGGTFGQAEPEPEYELYGLDVAQVATVTPQSTVTLDITINELDVNSLEIGMSAEVRIDALGSEKFTGTITDISNTGTNNGGYSSFIVELTMERIENMLAGMNASATMITSTVNDVLTLPAEALVEEGTQTIIYTGYDEKNEMLINPITVTVGASDGQNVEIVDGFEVGKTYYYAYYDTLEISFTPDFGGGMGGFSFGR